MSGNSRKLVFFIFLVGVTCISYQYMIKPANNDLKEKKAQVQKELGKLAEFEKAAAAVKDWNKQLVELQQAVKMLEDKLPPTSEIHKVLEQVTVIAQKEGLTPKTIRALKIKDNSGYVEQPLKMELTGDFNSFYSFLLEIERLPRIMKIRQLELGRLKGGTLDQTDGQVTANFVISIFFQNKAG